MFCDCFASNLFSKFRYPIFINPINCKEKIIITIPATILKISEFCKRVWPKKDADAPKIINTVEKPKQNKIKGNMFIFFDFKISCNDWPEIKETYPGIKGKTQGDKKLISPAPKAINNSIITFLLFYKKLYFLDFL